MSNETITLGAGCFWCLDAIARRISGFTSSIVGYAGDGGPQPTYRTLHSGANQGNWVEAVQLSYDADELTLDDVLELFFLSHDPTTPNQDGANFGSEYHSTIFYTDDEQRERAQEFIRAWQAKLDKPIVTTLRPLGAFYEGEPEHQDFYNQNSGAPYCRLVIHPKLAKLGLDS
jgi:peptide-methionine (S)-S-oxide reductase